VTAFYQFAPSSTPFQFQPTLDGSVYNCTVTWNLFGVRYYLNINALDGTLITSRGLVASPVGVAIQNIQWSNGAATVTTVKPHGYRIGSIVDLTLTDNVPAAYSGLFECLVTGSGTFSFLVAPNPGTPTQLGTASYDIDLAGQYFTTTQIVFRDGTQQFEVTDVVTSSGVPLVGSLSNIFVLSQSALGGLDVLG
jgi:hypothetical protein